MLLAPPNATLAFIFSLISFLSTIAELVSTSKIPYPRFLDILLLLIYTLAPLSTLIPAFLLYPMNEFNYIRVKFWFPSQKIPHSKFPEIERLVFILPSHLKSL